MDGIPDIVDAVLAFLAILSVVAWAVIVNKTVLFYKQSRQNKRFLQIFHESKDVFRLKEVTQNTSGALARVCGAGLVELQKLHAGDMPALSASDKREMLVFALKRQAQSEYSRMESGLGVLASIGSTSPFIGLFGTVWGIMHALKNISSSGSAGLDVVAGPIGEALIATAIGIAAAIPAVLAYNHFLRKVKASNVQMNHFGEAFQHLAIKSGLGT